MTETSDTFACFGSTCSVVRRRRRGRRAAQEAVAAARRLLLAWHDALHAASSPTSELSRLNADPRRRGARERVMAPLRRGRRGRRASRPAGSSTGRCCARSRPRATAPTSRRRCRSPLALRLAPRAPPGAPEPRARAGASSRVDRTAAPSAGRPGVALDSGGLAKGLFADVLAERARRAPERSRSTARATCASAARPASRGRSHVAEPVRRRASCTRSSSRGGGVATSGIGRRSWLDAAGRPAHHLLDPATGRAGVHRRRAGRPRSRRPRSRPRCAPRRRSSAAPTARAEWLPDGGVVVADDGGFEVVAPSGRARPGSAAEHPSRALPGRPSAPSGGRARVAAAAPSR